MAIDKTYWDERNKISASPRQKLDLVDYEIWMFLETCRRLSELPRPPQFEMNLLVESVAVHSRTLINFFYPEGTKEKPSDVTARDFIENWDDIKPGITQTLFDAKNKTDKQLAHLSTWRIKIEKDNKKGWEHEIYSDLEKVIEKFRENLIDPNTSKI